MKRIIFVIFLLLVMSPAFVGIVDFYSNFFTGNQLSNINWTEPKVYFALFTTAIAPLLWLDI